MGKRLSVKDWVRLLARDGYRCLHCGTDDALAPNHRKNRGMGGSKALDVNSAANLVLLCSRQNGLIESDASHRAAAIAFGWKLEQWQTVDAPVYDANLGAWFVLDSAFNRVQVATPEPMR